MQATLWVCRLYCLKYLIRIPSECRVSAGRACANSLIVAAWPLSQLSLLRFFSSCLDT